MLLLSDWIILPRESSPGRYHYAVLGDQEARNETDQTEQEFRFFSTVPVHRPIHHVEKDLQVVHLLYQIRK